jgi:hypothetical protein
MSGSFRWLMSITGSFFISETGSGIFMSRDDFVSHTGDSLKLTEHHNLQVMGWNEQQKSTEMAF